MTKLDQSILSNQYIMNQIDWRIMIMNQWSSPRNIYGIDIYSEESANPSEKGEILTIIESKELRTYYLTYSIHFRYQH